jgi:transposase
MSKFNIVAGIDVGKSSLVVCIRDANGKTIQSQYSNDAKGLHCFIEDIKALTADVRQVLVCCENTGRYISRLAHVCKSYEIVLWAVHPMIIANYELDLKRGKTDAGDALKLCSMLFTTEIAQEITTCQRARHWS